MHNILDQFGGVLLRYCCLPSHRQVVPFLEFCQPTITGDKTHFQLLIVAPFFIINRFSFKHDKFSKKCRIFERRFCIQLRTSSSRSTSVSFLLPPSSLKLFPFMDVTFSFLWNHSRTLFRSTSNFFAPLWIEFFLSVFNSGLFKLHPFWNIA